jgi:serine/threonine protein kinase
MIIPDQDESLGEILCDRYLIHQQLGKKSGRRTLLTQDLVTQEQVVIKLLMFNRDFEWDDLKLFEREAQVLKTLNHPAVPRYIDYFELDKPTYKGFGLIQTYIPADSLEMQLKAGRTFSEVELKELAQVLLEILIHLHRQNPPVIHRDIKPSNILLSDRSGNSIGQVFLVDFGSVQTLAAQTGGTITVVGTYGYMPPEQFGGRAVPASDLYGLGATLIHLATGIPPADLPQQNLRLQFANHINLSPHFAAWLTALTEPALEQRLETANQALQALTQKNSDILNFSSHIDVQTTRQVYPGRWHELVIEKSTEKLEIRQEICQEFRQEKSNTKKNQINLLKSVISKKQYRSYLIFTLLILPIVSFLSLTFDAIASILFMMFFMIFVGVFTVSMTGIGMFIGDSAGKYVYWLRKGRYADYYITIDARRDRFDFCSTRFFFANNNKDLWGGMFNLRAQRSFSC